MCHFNINKTRNLWSWESKVVLEGLFPLVFMTIDRICDIFFNQKLKLNKGTLWNRLYLGWLVNQDKLLLENVLFVVV